MVDHTVGIVANIDIETNFGGGVAGAIYSEATLAQDMGNPMQAPFGSLDMPFMVKDRMYAKLMGMGAGSVKIFNKGELTPQVTFEQYIQNDRWLDAFVTNITQTLPALPDHSFCLHWENGIRHKEDVYGIIPINIKLALEKGSEENIFPRQTTDVSFFASKTAVAADYTESGFDLTQPVVNDDVELTIAGFTSGDLKWEKIDVLMGYIFNKQGTIGNTKNKYPYSVDLELSVDLAFWDYDADLLDTQEASPTDHDVTIKLGTAGGTLTKNTLKTHDLVVNTSNVNAFPEFGLFKYEINLIPGNNFVLADDFKFEAI